MCGYMPWCPKCTTEYREGFTKCSNCGSELVNQLQTTENKNNKDNDNDKDNDDVFTFLVNVKDEIEFSLLESMLKQESIPILKKYRESGGYLSIYTGNTLFGIDIYVPSKLLDTARDIIMPYNGIEEEDNESANNGYANYSNSETEESKDENVCETSNEINHKHLSKKRKRVRIILLFFISGIIVLLIYFTLALTHLIRNY